MRTLGSRDQAEKRFGIGPELRLGQAGQSLAALAYIGERNASGTVAQELKSSLLVALLRLTPRSVLGRLAAAGQRRLGRLDPSSADL